MKIKAIVERFVLRTEFKSHLKRKTPFWGFNGLGEEARNRDKRNNHMLTKNSDCQTENYWGPPEVMV